MRNFLIRWLGGFLSSDFAQANRKIGNLNEKIGNLERHIRILTIEHKRLSLVPGEAKAYQMGYRDGIDAKRILMQSDLKLRLHEIIRDL